MDLKRIFEQFQDHLAPRLDTYEQAVYLYVLRHSRLVGLQEVTIGFKSARKKMAFGVGEAGKPMFGKPGLKEPRFFAPVLDTFVRALPVTYRDVSAEEGAVVVMTITGSSGGRWALRRERQAWKLYVTAPTRPSAEVVIDEETAWRMFTKGIHREHALSKAELLGDKSLASKALDAVAIIA